MAVRARRTQAGARALAAAILLLAAGAAVAGKTYRWTDEQGHVHYTDAPPPEAARFAGSGASGRQDRTAPAEDDASASSNGQGERRRRDRMLLQSYGSIEALERTRDRRLDGVDSEIEYAAHRAETVRARVHRLERRLAELDGGDGGRAAVEARLEAARERLEERERALARLKARRERIAEEFARDRERYLELKGRERGE